MQNKYSPLFSPLQLGKLTLKNRIIMAPMDDGFDGVDDRAISYLAERAKGGASMIMTGACISNSVCHDHLNTLTDKDTMFNIAYLAEAVHAGGAALCVQFTAGEGRNSIDAVTGKSYSASDDVDFVWAPGMKCEALTVEQIQQILNETQEFAAKCKFAGVDCIDIHAHNGYLLDQFMSAVWNHRTDEYGGSFENRMRFMTEYIAAIRAGVGPDVPIIPHITTDMTIPGMRQPGETEAIMKYLDGLDDVQGFVVDWGCYECIDKIIPSCYYGEDCELYLTDMLHEIGITKPIMISGNLSPESALAAVAEGKSDAVLLGRSLIADPELPNKLYHGNDEDIRPCLICGMCLHNKEIRGLSCAVNAEMGIEDCANSVKPCKRQKVVVIGGGVGGMEAARMSAVRGAQVVLMEKSDHLGGTALDMATADWKTRYPKYVKWAATQLEKLGVKVILNAEVTPDTEELKNADRIFVATGAAPVVPAIPGIDGANVVHVLDVHKDMSLAKGNEIVVIGGGLAGSDLALELAENGKKLTILEAGPQIGVGSFGMNIMSLMQRLAVNNVVLYPNTVATKISADGVEAMCEDNKLVIPADTVIYASGIQPENSLGISLMKRYPGIVQLIGDARNGSNVFDAVHDGYNAALSLE